MRQTRSCRLTFCCLLLSQILLASGSSPDQDTSLPTRIINQSMGLLNSKKDSLPVTGHISHRNRPHQASSSSAQNNRKANAPGERQDSVRNSFWLSFQEISCADIPGDYDFMPEEKTLPPAPVPEKKPLFQVHGNILYDLNYWSRVDTPYAERNVYQHTVQSYLDITYKDNYPFRVYLTTRWGNSSLFRSFTDLNLQFNAADFRNKIRTKAMDLMQHNPFADSLAAWKRLLEEYEKKYLLAKFWIDTSGAIQRMIAVREKTWLRQLAASDGKTDSLPINPADLKDPKAIKQAAEQKAKGLPDSLDRLVDERLDTLSGIKRKYDSAQAGLAQMKNKLDSLRKRYQQAKELFDHQSFLQKKDIDQLSSGRELKDQLDALHIPDSSLPKGYQILYSIRSLGIGRSVLDYSELSAKNISITGLQVEYTPSNYMAFAAGTVDYRFRDYTMQHASKGQYIALARYGWGKKEGNNVIVTYYTGRRQLYNAFSTAQATIPNYNLMGLTIEGHYRIGKTGLLTAEVAKSSTPYYSLDSTRSHGLLASTFDMGNRNNEAYALKLNTYLRSTQTQIAADYKHIGANFQSFSLFTTGSTQNAWSVRVDQPLFKKHLLVSASVRTNDFSNPFVNAAYQANTLFKSIQATWRYRKWPTLSVGYFPTSQVVKLNNDQFQENLFYMFMASANHIYAVHGRSMMAMALYTQFYNRPSDSSFVYYNTRNLLISNSAFLGNITWQLQLSASENTSYALYTVDNKIDYKISGWLSLGAGIKYNRQTVYQIRQFGYSGNALVRMGKIGELRLMYDKGFLPGYNRQLVRNDLGRLTYFKTF